MDTKEIHEMDAYGMIRTREIPYTFKMKCREKFEKWLARVTCYMFHRPYKCYVWPKNLRENQYNCVFYARFPLTKTKGEKFFIYQFDIKGDKDRTYEVTEEEFMKHWEILSYMGEAKKQFNRFERLIKEEKLCHEMPFRKVDYITTKFNGKPVHYHS